MFNLNISYRFPFRWSTISCTKDLIIALLYFTLSIGVKVVLRYVGLTIGRDTDCTVDVELLHERWEAMYKSTTITQDLEGMM